jgi:ZIP family zinc transporter
MLSAFLWGFGAAASLVLGAAIAGFIKISRRVLGLIMAFGVGVLISAIAFELAEEAFEADQRGWMVAGGLAAGALVFFFGNILIDKMGGRSHRTMKGEAGSGTSILLGTIMDGIPESIVIGLALVKGGSISVAMVVAVFLSNLPEAISATTGLIKSKWSMGRVLALWGSVALAAGVASWAGFTFFDTAPAATLAFTLSFAAGALLTMIADSMMPEAFRDSGKLVGLVTTAGFGLAFLISMVGKG